MPQRKQVRPLGLTAASAAHPIRVPLFPPAVEAAGSGTARYSWHLLYGEREGEEAEDVPGRCYRRGGDNCPAGPP